MTGPDRERGETVSVSAPQKPRMYVSPAVRSIREDPVAGESVTLLLEVTDEADVDAVAEAAADVGTVEGRLPFETLQVTVLQERVSEVCALDGLAVVETAATLTIDADGAGEDVDPGG